MNIKYGFITDNNEFLGIDVSSNFCSFDNCCNIEYELTTGENVIWFTDSLVNAFIVLSNNNTVSKECPYLAKTLMEKVKLVAVCTFDNLTSVVIRSIPQKIEDIVSEKDALLYSSYVFKGNEYVFDQENFNYVKHKFKEKEYKIDYFKVFYILEKQLDKKFLNKEKILEEINFKIKNFKID